MWTSKKLVDRQGDGRLDGKIIIERVREGKRRMPD
jgi:hypothetical protein